MLKLALQVAINSKWTIILSPDDLRRYPKLWLEDLFTLNKEVKRQLSHLKANIEE